MKSPGWIKKFVSARWKALARHTKISQDEPLGCGHYGCVYPTNDPHWVVKITRDPTEGPLVQKIMALRAEQSRSDGTGPQHYLDGIVFFKAVFEADTIEWRSKTWPVYVIVREAIVPPNARGWYDPRYHYALRDDSSIPPKYEQRSLDALSAAQTAALRYHQAAARKRGSPALESDLLARYANALSDVGDAYPEISETLYNLADDNIVLRDVHRGNIGRSENDWGDDYRSPGTVVIHDLGHTPTDAPQEQLPALGWNPARSRR